jgi:putative endonuclease
MEKYRQKIGKLGEGLAIRYLKKKGYEIIAQNIFYRSGEIDILAKIKRKYYFIEVKTRTSNAFGYPEEGLNDGKLDKIYQTVEKYLLEHSKIKDWQVDCLSVELNINEKLAKIYHLKDI